MASLSKLPTRPLGKNGPQVPRLGLGLMGLSGVYGTPAADAERLAFLDEAYKQGEVFWDTGKFAAMLFRRQILGNSASVRVFFSGVHD